MKAGLQSSIGGQELLEDFYKVFCVNMRDLGSPVHTKKMMYNVIEQFPETARIIIIYQGDNPLACSVVVGYKNILENPWASALRKYGRLSANMLLYWTMLEYGCDNGYTCFDFGRSTPGEGTYRFKEQWGANSAPLNWHYLSSDGKALDGQASEKFLFQKVAQLWSKLPVFVTRIIGPGIRKYIGL
jgi:hypothetical protein